VRRGVTSFEVVAFALSILSLIVAVIVLYATSVQMTHVQNQVAALGKTLQGLSKEINALKAQVQELMKYSPIYSG